MQLSGVTNLATKDYATAYREFDVYDRVPPGNPNAAFFKGISLEAMHTGRLWRWAAATGDAEIDFCAIAT